MAAEDLTEKRQCMKCGKVKRTCDFYKKKDGTRASLCKQCISMHIDNRKPETFLWILKDFDVPYVEDVWVTMTNRAYMRNPQAFGSMSVIGTYLRTMLMAQYRNYGYADSDKFNINSGASIKERRKRYMEQYNDEREEELAKKLANGEISQAEYDTVSMKSALDKLNKLEEDLENQKRKEVYDIAEANAEKPKEFINPIAVPQEDITNIASAENDTSSKFIPDVASVSEDKIYEQLTPDDVQYLALKWGMLYKPSEWVKLEEIYQKYASEYELNTDREQALKMICKTTLKMDQALDVGDTRTFKDLQAANDMMRKSAKFTDAQNKQEVTRDIDSIGELVAFVENEGGIIPRMDDPIEEPQDKIDFLINDMKNYVDNLVRNELGLGDLIESFVEKVNNNEVKTAEQIMAESFVDDDSDVLTNKEAEDFMQFQIEEIEAESQKLVNDFGAA